MPPRLKFSGRIAPDDPLHQVLGAEEAVDATGYPVIAPTYVDVPGIGQVPQYASTVASQTVGYDPAGDCQGYYMSYRYQPNNNCYAYGCNIASNSFPQPGRLHSYRYSNPPTGPSVEEGAVQDGLITVGTTEEELAEHAASAGAGHYVALLISEADTDNGWPGDYHWVRCDDPVQFRSWSQKDGSDQVTNFDFAGAPIISPPTANWTVNQGPISAQNPDDLIVNYTFFSYMFVPWGSVSII